MEERDWANFTAASPVPPATFPNGKLFFNIVTLAKRRKRDQKIGKYLWGKSSCYAISYVVFCCTIAPLKI